MIMTELFTNKAMEDDMTKKFLCILYFRDRNERQVIENGLNPNIIGTKWDITRLEQV